jgi:hypothetical protein
MYSGRIEDIARLLHDLAKDGPDNGCAWQGLGQDEERCGEEASHFHWEWNLGRREGDGSERGRYIFLCEKHATFNHAMSDDGFDYWNEEVMDLEGYLDRVDNHGGDLRTIIEKERAWAKAMAQAYLDYAHGAAALEGPGRVEELDQLYGETVNSARHQHSG